MTQHISPFDAIRKVDEQNGHEYWSARDLFKLLDYSTWQKFQYAIEQAKTACKKSGFEVNDHFNLEVKMVSIGSGAKRKRNDYRLSRYACYLIVQNADPSKSVVAMGQTYFAAQTRRQELADQLAALPEDQKRIILRTEMAVFNAQLAATAQKAGVIRPDDFAIFQDHGYIGLYDGLHENDIHTRKNLAQGQQILDYMGSEELGANIFRATQTEAKLRREQVKGRERANRTHFQVGRKVRQTIKELGGTMPEDLPTPTKSVQQLQQEEIERQQRRLQPLLFNESETDEQV